MSRLQNIKQHINRKVPYGVLSWRYLLPGQSANVLLHKAVFMYIWPNKPLILRIIIAVFSYTKWFTFQGWFQLGKIWKKYSPILKKENGISRKRQFTDLLKLVFLQTTPPHFYYRYSLYRYTTLEWLNFIYPHELPNWHSVMSPYLSSKTMHLLSDKADFASEIQKQNFPVIEGVVIRKGNQLTEDQLFRQNSLFLKPLCGSRRKGAYELKYDMSLNKYTLTISDNQIINDKKEILSFSKSIAQNQDYLIQPLLLNHPDLQKLSEYHSLITFRVITVWAENIALPISAIAEFPINDSSEYVCIFPVDLPSGIIQAKNEKAFTIKNDIYRKFEHLPGHQVILWHEMMDVAQKAHAFFPDLFSIGWDLAITPEGIRLIEGNINWGVAQHQTIGPILMPAHISYARPDILNNKHNRKK
jgi:hypothetical protein